MAVTEYELQDSISQALYTHYYSLSTPMPMHRHWILNVCLCTKPFSLDKSYQTTRVQDSKYAILPRPNSGLHIEKFVSLDHFLEYHLGQLMARCPNTFSFSVFSVLRGRSCKSSIRCPREDPRILCP
ncbi:hypothetical protein BDR22DRAFT_179402 [Usnea florida]